MARSGPAALTPYGSVILYWSAETQTQIAYRHWDLSTSGWKHGHNSK